MSNKRNHVDDLRGASRLAVEATKGVVDLVQAMHVTIGGAGLLGSALESVTRLVTAPVYRNIQGVTSLVGGTLDAAFARLAPLLGEGTAPSPTHEAFLAVLNGVFGDYLVDTKNPLALDMSFRVAGQPLDTEALPDATSRLVVFVHGSSMNDLMWNRRGHDHGAALARDLGVTTVYLRYNSGLHVSTNGKTFAGLLEQLVASWPVPLDRLDLVGHSMGGLVARSACHYGAEHAWRTKLRTLITVGTPHHGAPLERGGNFVDVALGVSRFSAPLARLGKIRSAGVTDLRHGNLLDEDWEGRDRFSFSRELPTIVPLPADVDCYAIAGTTSAEGDAAPRGDGLVPVASALGQSNVQERSLAFARTWIAYQTGHVDLLDRPAVYATLLAWLGRDHAPI